jgi:hypothetical protein
MRGSGIDNEPNAENATTIAQAEQWLDESIERNLDRGARAAAQLDRTLISLSAGALVLSMTFVGAAAPGKCLLVVLFASWVCFIAAMILVIVAMRSQQEALESAVKNASDALRNLKADKSVKVVFAKMGIPLTEKKVTASKTVAVLNNWTLGAFIAGVVLLGVFVGSSLWHNQP